MHAPRRHLPVRQTAKIVGIVDRLLADGGVFVVGVPNELLFPALVKRMFRMTRRHGAHDARFGNVLRAAREAAGRASGAQDLARPPLPLPPPRLRPP